MAERRSVRAMQWLATRAQVAGMVAGMARLATADAARCQAEGLGQAQPESALAAAAHAFALDPQSGRTARLLGSLRLAMGDVAGAEQAFRMAFALAQDQVSAVAGLCRIAAGGDPAQALMVAEAAAFAAPTQARLWEGAAEAAQQAGNVRWAVALGLIQLSQAVDQPDAHRRMAALHAVAGDPVAAAFRKVTAARLKAAAHPAG